MVPDDFSLGFFIFELFLGEILLTAITTFAAVVIFDRLKSHRQEKQHGGWSVKIMNGETLLKQSPVSTQRQMEIGEDTAARDVFLKGRTSPHTWINCDIVDLLTVQGRTYVIDIAKNPKKEKLPWRVVTSLDDEPIDWLIIEGRSVKVDVQTLAKVLKVLPSE